ncbi:MAG: hypothetical protein ACRENP_12105 [Longimicrobiales bacterium]
MKTFRDLNRAGPTHRARRFLLGAGVLALTLFFGAACDGDNLFSGTNSATRPSLTLELPSEVLAGDTLSVRVDARAPHGLDRIELHITGPLIRDTTYMVPEGAASVSPVFRYRMPDLFADPVMIVAVSVLDKLGVTNTATDTVTAIPRLQ